MRGGFVHNNVLRAVEKVLRLEIVRAKREFFVPWRDGHHSFIDLWVEIGTERIAIEVEMTANRIQKDVAKALTANATQLLIIVPNHDVERKVKGRLLFSSLPENLKIYCLTLGKALQLLKNRSLIKSDAYVLQTS